MKESSFQIDLSLKNCMIVIGLIISCVGLGIHASPYSAADSGIMSVAPGNQYIKNLEFPELKNSYYIINFQIAVFNSTDSDVSFAWVNQTEYDKWNTGETIENLQSIMPFKSSIELQGNETTVAFNGTITRLGNATEYIILVNHSNVTKTFMYFYSTTTPAYNTGWMYLMYGIFLIFGVIIYYAQGPRKWMFVGIAVNTIFFLTRIALLSKNYSVIAIGSGWTVSNPEIYSDFQYYTIQWTNQIRQGILPYTPEMSTYIFPPLFVLTMFLFDFLPLPVWRLGLPLLGATIGIGVVLMQILKHFFPDKKNERLISFGILVYFLNPFVLIYGSFAWLNPSLFVFWTILSVYYMLKNKPVLSMAMLGIACMYKQFAALLLPLMFLLIWKPNFTQIKTTIIQAIRYLSAFCIPILIISIPFLIISPTTYLRRVLIGNTTFDIERLILLRFDPSWPVSISGTLAYAEMPPWLIYITAFLDVHYIFLGASFLGIILYELQSIKKMNFDYSNQCNLRFETNNRNIWQFFFSWIVLLILLTQLFYPRGTYKYYLMFLAPYFALYFATFLPRILESKEKRMPSFKRETFEKQLVSLIMIGLWILVFFNRFLYFWLLIGWIGIMLKIGVGIQRHQNPSIENVA